MDYFKDFMAMARQRVKNPLFFALFVSWLAFNYDYLFIMFSGDPLPVKIATVKSTVYRPDLFGYDLNGVLVTIIRSAVAPILMALAYIKFMPGIQKWLVEVWDKEQTEILNQQKEAQGKTLLSEKDRDNLLEAHEKERNNWDVIRKNKEEALERAERLAKTTDVKHQEILQEKIEIIEKLRTNNTQDLDAFNNKIESLEKDIEAMTKEKMDLVKQIDDSDEILAKLEREKDSAYLELRKADNLKKSYENKYSQELHEKKSLQRNLANATEQKESTKKQLDNVMNELAQASKNNAEIVNYIDKLINTQKFLSWLISRGEDLLVPIDSLISKSSSDTIIHEPYKTIIEEREMFLNVLGKAKEILDSKNGTTSNGNVADFKTYYESSLNNK